MKNIYNSDEVALDYHRRQWDQPNRSTVAFEEFVRSKLEDSRRVLDLGCGGGAATAYLAMRHSTTAFLGVDYTDSLVKMASEEVRQRALTNLSFELADWYALPDFPPIDGVVSLQTLGWTDDWQRALEIVFNQIRPHWIGISSLFYPGDISCAINISEHKRYRSYAIQIIALPLLKRFANENGYDLAESNQFNIDVDLMRGDVDTMGTFTVRAQARDGEEMRRIQFSGPVLMNWYNVMLTRLV